VTLNDLKMVTDQPILQISAEYQMNHNYTNVEEVRDVLQINYVSQKACAFIHSVSTVGQWHFQELPIILEITLKITQPPVPDTCAMTCHVRNDSSQAASHWRVSRVCCMARAPLGTKGLVSIREADHWDL
jgi:hypothetical protein